MATVSAKKNVNVSKMLKKLTPEQSKALADQINGGMGSGKKPATKKPVVPKKKK